MELVHSYLDELTQSRLELMREFATKSHHEPVNGGRWSGRQILHHLYLSELGIAKIFRSAERVCIIREAYSDDQLLRERTGLSEFFLNRSIQVAAPQRIDPADLSDDVDVVNELKASRKFLVEQLPQLSDEQLRTLQFHHNLRGELTLYGWLWFVASHERRHTFQLRDIGSDTTGK